MHSVLYIDDEPKLLEIGKLFLEISHELSLDTKTSAQDGLQAMKLHHYDAIVSDYQMPKINGIEFLKEVRSIYGDIPFIIFTGKGREEVVIEALNNGADFYLQKGGEPNIVYPELMHVIKRAILMRETQLSFAEQE
ncbi:MAG TPA: response regulator, partial [Methanoregulaceae archaeon]|nr:response regulator [Methanoregulaceae archaeon]